MTIVLDKGKIYGHDILNSKIYMSNFYVTKTGHYIGLLVDENKKLHDCSVRRAIIAVLKEHGLEFDENRHYEITNSNIQSD